LEGIGSGGKRLVKGVIEGVTGVSGGKEGEDEALLHTSSGKGSNKIVLGLMMDGMVDFVMDRW